MKINKAQFKKILKECIRELIEDGSFNAVIKENAQYAPPATSSTNNNSKRAATNDLVNPNQDKESSPNSVPWSRVGQMTPAQRLADLARVTAAGASSGDPERAALMENIFADTAMTTYQKQMATEPSPGNRGAYIGESYNEQDARKDQAELESLSQGKGVGHWAALAFGKYEK